MSWSTGVVIGELHADYSQIELDPGRAVTSRAWTCDRPGHQWYGDCADLTVARQFGTITVEVGVGRGGARPRPSWDAAVEFFIHLANAPPGRLGRCPARRTSSAIAACSALPRSAEHCGGSGGGCCGGSVMPSSVPAGTPTFSVSVIMSVPALTGDGAVCRDSLTASPQETCRAGRLQT